VFGFARRTGDTINGEHGGIAPGQTPCRSENLVAPHSTQESRYSVARAISAGKKHTASLAVPGARTPHGSARVEPVSARESTSGWPMGPCCRRTRGRQVSGTHLSAAEKPQGVRAVSGATWAARYQRGIGPNSRLAAQYKCFPLFLLCFIFYFPHYFTNSNLNPNLNSIL
jgi:hypothetical protein